MSNDPAFLFYPGDYLRDTQCLSESVQVAYDRIMCEHMRNICISQAQLNFFTKRLNEDEKSELDMVLTKIDSGFQIKWIAESIVKRKAYSESRRNNRSKKDNNISSTYDEHMDNENENEIEVKKETEIKSINALENSQKPKGIKVTGYRSPMFAIFWELYAKKTDTVKCQLKFDKLTPAEVQLIMQRVAGYVKSTPDITFRKNPLTWLNGKCWNDEIILENNNNNNNNNGNNSRHTTKQPYEFDLMRALGQTKASDIPRELSEDAEYIDVTGD